MVVAAFENLIKVQQQLGLATDPHLPAFAQLSPNEPQVRARLHRYEALYAGSTKNHPKNPPYSLIPALGQKKYFLGVMVEKLRIGAVVFEEEIDVIEFQRDVAFFHRWSNL